MMVLPVWRFPSLSKVADTGSEWYLRKLWTTRQNGRGSVTSKWWSPRWKEWLRECQERGEGATLPRDTPIPAVPSQELLRKWVLLERRVCFFKRTGIVKYRCKTLPDTKTKEQNTQSSETQVWGDAGGRDKGTQCSDCLGWRDIAYWWGPGGGAAEIRAGAPGRKAGPGGRSSRTGLRCQGPAEQSPEGAGRRHSGLVLPPPAHLWRRQNEGWEAKQEEILTGTWEPKQQVPTAALQDTAGLGQESRAWSHGMLAFPFSASAPPHSLCHTTLFSPLSVTGGAIFPNAVEEQPPPPTRNLLQLWEGVPEDPALRCGDSPAHTHGSHPQATSRASHGIPAQPRTEAAQCGWILRTQLRAP